MNPILTEQLALDYCCETEDVLDDNNHFTEYKLKEGRRRFDADETCFLKIVSVNGKILATGRRDVIDLISEKYGSCDGAWFMEGANIALLESQISKFGYGIYQIHPFFICEKPNYYPSDRFALTWYEKDEIECFRGDKRFDEAYSFLDRAPDVIGISAAVNGEIVGMAGASLDSPTMLQIGINTVPGNERKGIARLLVSRLAEEILRRGYLPYYGTALSHIASQKVALSSGFTPAWAELITSEK